MAQVNAHQVAGFYSKQASQLGQLIDAHRETSNKLRQVDSALEGEVAIAQRELAAIYLPALTDEALARAAKLTGFQGFDRRDPRVAMAQEKKVLQAQLVQLDADPRYQKRDTLVGPAGTLQQELDSSREALAPLQEACEKFETQLGFQELLDVGYDTPSFKEHWWNAGYWHHWAAGDRICKALGMKDFGDDVIPAYKAVAEPRDTMRADVTRLEAEIDAVHSTVQARDQAADRLGRLDEIYLESAQGFLGEHLAHADLALLEQWIGSEPEARAVQQGLRRLAGVQAKRKIVEEIARQGVPQVVSDLQQRQQKAMQKASKFQRPKYAYSSFPASSIDPNQQAKLDALAAQNTKLQSRLDSLVAYDDYSRFTLTNDYPLWWMYFFGSPPHRYYTPWLYDYYQRNPGLAVIEDTTYLDPDPADAVGAALAAGDLEQGAYLS
jgi:hypothetical protein